MAKYKQFYEKGFPYETGHWAEWSSLERFEWMRDLNDRINADDGKIAKKLGYSQSDLDELAADTEACRQTGLQEIAVRESQIRDAEIRALLFEELLLRCLDEKTAVPLTMLPSETLTKVADYNMDSVKELPPIIERFANMSDRELIAAARAVVLHIRKNIGKDPYTTEEFAWRLSGQTDKLEMIAQQQVKPNDNAKTDGGMGGMGMGM